MFAARSAFKVTPFFLAILLKVSPDFTTYAFSTPVSVAARAPGTAGVSDADEAGMMSFLPGLSFFGSTPGFVSSMALTVTPFFLAILPSVSPETMVYSVPAAGATGATGGGVTGGATGGGNTAALVAGGGKFVSSGGGRFVSSAGAFVSNDGVVSGASRLQPWMSMTTRQLTLAARMRNTVSLRRERR